MGFYTSACSFEAVLSQVRQIGPQRFKLPRDIALQSIHNSHSSEKPFWCHFKRNQARKILVFLYERAPCWQGGRNLPATFTGENGESNSIAPWNANRNHSIKGEGIYSGAVRKREQGFFISALEMGTMLM